MSRRSLIGAIVWIALSQAGFAEETIWNWMFISAAPGADAKSAWYTDQGTVKGSSSARGFDLHIGGAATAADPDHLGLYDLKGAIRGSAVTAELIGLDTDEVPQKFTGKLVTKDQVDRISLVGADGTTLLLYRPAKHPN